MLTLTLMVSDSPARSAPERAAAAQPAENGYALVPTGSRVSAPKLEIRDINGQNIVLSRFKGKVVLLDFWAVACGGCKVEIPWYVEFDHKFHSKGLDLIGIDMYGEDPKVIKPFMSKMGMAYPVAVGTDAIGKEFRVREMPLTLLVDRSGRIAISHAGIVDKVQFENDIKQLLQ